MKRIILIAAALLAVAPLFAQNSFTERYSTADNAETITLTKAQFNLIQPLIGLDKETRKLLKALNLSQFTMINLSRCNDAVKDRVREDFNNAGQGGIYQRIDDSEDSRDMLFRIEEGYVITEFLLLMDKKDKDGPVIILIDCNARIDDIT